MKRILVIIIICCVSHSIFADEILQLSNGKKIIVFDDFTWQYIEKKEEKDGLDFLSLSKSHQQSAYYQDTEKKFTFYYDPNKWIKTYLGLPMVEAAFQNNDNTAYGIIIKEGLEFPIESLPNIILQSVRMVASDLELVSVSDCQINGTRGKLIKYEAVTDGISFTFLDFATSNAKGTFQINFYTASYLFNELEKSFIDAISGFYN